jgi:peptidyl-dipeptidase Dcp
MEHWATEPEVMQAYARHLDSDEIIPMDLVEKLIESEKFNQGFATSEYLAASYLDLAWHELGDDVPQVDDLEAMVAEGIGLNDAIDPRYLSTYFQHIFSGESYSAGYYSYIWAEVLDADGFEVFKENGIFDAQTAKAFRKHILQAGGTADPGILYQRFAGHEPVVEPLLRQRGLA